MRNCKVAILSILLAALLCSGSTQDDDFEKAILGNTCKGQKDDECKLKPTTVSFKGNRENLKKLQELHERRANRKGADEEKERMRRIEEKDYDDTDLPPELKQKLREMYGEEEEIEQQGPPENLGGNIRNLFSVNPDNPLVDESDYIAYERDYIYTLSFKEESLRIYQVGPGGTLTLNQVSYMDPDYTLTHLVVSNGMIAILAHKITYPSRLRQIKLYLLHHNSEANTVTNIDVLYRKGSLIAARQLNGQLTFVTQSDGFPEQWTSESGNIESYFSGCAAWDYGIYSRDIGTISLTLNPDIKIASFYGCDGASKAMLSETGNWYIPSSYENTVYNTIIQKAPMNNIQHSQWVAKADLTIRFGYWLFEEDGCQVQVAGQSSNLNPLKLLRLGCIPFVEIFSKDNIGPADTMISNVRWTKDYVYASFSNMQLSRYNAIDYADEGVIYENFRMNSMQEYGKNHLIGLGSYGDSEAVVAALYSTSRSDFSHRMDYRIVQTNNEQLILFAPPHGLHQFFNVDYSLRMVVFPILSTGNEPFRAGLYYLRVEVEPSDSSYCMIHPPTSQCGIEGGIGQQATKTFTTTGRLYKHWDPPGATWPGNQKSQTPSRQFVMTTDKKYLISSSTCQLQIRIHPNDNNGNLPLSPAANLDLCP